MKKEPSTKPYVRALRNMRLGANNVYSILQGMSNVVSQGLVDIPEHGKWVIPSKALLKPGRHYLFLRKTATQVTKYHSSRLDYIARYEQIEYQGVAIPAFIIVYPAQHITDHLTLAEIDMIYVPARKPATKTKRSK